jgi:predicted lipoprotein with Yx(FWY)xxD motif
MVARVGSPVAKELSMTKKYSDYLAVAPIAVLLMSLLLAGLAGLPPVAAQVNVVPSYPTVPALPQASAQLSVRPTAFGTSLTDAYGRSLYLFEGDTSSSASLCTGTCASVWIPFVIQGGPGVALPLGSNVIPQTLIGAFVRSDGYYQISFNGHPLYYYSGDGGSATTTNGEGLNQFGSFWYLIDPNGHALTLPVIQ